MMNQDSYVFDEETVSRIFEAVKLIEAWKSYYGTPADIPDFEYTWARVDAEPVDGEYDMSEAIWSTGAWAVLDEADNGRVWDVASDGGRVYELNGITGVGIGKIVPIFPIPTDDAEDVRWFFVGNGLNITSLTFIKDIQLSGTTLQVKKVTADVLNLTDPDSWETVTNWVSDTCP